MAEPIVEDQVIDNEEAAAADLPENLEKEVEEKPVEEPEGDEGQQEEDEETPEEKPSRRKELRIQQLLTKLTGKETAAAPQKPTEGLDYKTALEADEETVKALDDDRRKYGESLYRQGLEQAKAIQFQTRLEVDAPRVEAKYPVLDKESPKFNPVVANALNQMYLSAVGWNPQTGSVANANVRYSDYIEGIMELSDEVASERVAKSAKNIAKQAAATGLRPSGSTSKRLNLNQAPQNMTDEELKAVIAQAIPSK